MSNQHTDNFARIIAIVSLIIAILAVVVPFSQQLYIQKKQNKQFEQLQKEDLSLNLSPYVDGTMKITEINLGTMGHVVQVPWKLIISNNGNRNLSIVSFDVRRGELEGNMFYTGINGGVFTQAKTPEPLPINLEAGESKILIVNIGITVPTLVYDILVSNGKENILTDGIATKILGRKGVDLYGNKVEFREYDQESYSLTIEETEKAQRIWIEFVTGRNNKFITQAKKYENI